MVGVFLIAAGLLGFAIPVFTTRKTDTVASIGGTTVPMSRYILSVTFNPNAAKPAATPAAGRRKAKTKDE